MAEKTRTHVDVSITEQILILQSYSANRCNWPVVLADVKKGIEMLPEAAQTLYKEGAFHKLKRRMSDQVKKLRKEGACGGNEELVGLAEEIKTNDTRYSQKHHPAVKRQLAKKVCKISCSVERNLI